MEARAHVREAARRTPSDTKALAALTTAVYPPEQSADWPGKVIQWSNPQWDVEVLDRKGTLISYTALVIREARHEDRPVLIAGIGGVKTHPAARGLGHATVGIGAALDFAAERDADFALLVCEPSLVPYYERLGWALFHGTMLTVQNGAKTPFEFNLVMVTSLGSAAPEDGTIDLEGPPW